MIGRGPDLLNVIEVLKRTLDITFPANGMLLLNATQEHTKIYIENIM